MLGLMDVIIIYMWAGRAYHYIMSICIYIYIYLYIYIYIYIYIYNSCAFSYTQLTPKDGEVRDVTILLPEAHYIVNHNYCYMPKYTDRS